MKLIKRDLILICSGLLVVLVACSTVPYTERTQFNLISPSQEKQLGEEAYQDILSKNKLSLNQEYRAQVSRVGANIKKSAEKPEFDWEFNVLQGKEVNAFCLPGGKVAFWDGIMPICGTDAGVAVVMGHEIAHALARHGAERMSQNMGAQIVGTLLATGLGGADPAVQKNVMNLYGIGTQVGVLLPFSRSHESEADKIGLILMAKAGYDPREAIEFWKRMDAQSKGQSPPEFLSTHPTHNTRISNLESWLPEALSHYKER